MTPLANILQPLIDVAHTILRFFHDSAGLSWGFSIIALTVVVRLAILPLTFKQVRAMQVMQQHMPELKKIQERYKEDAKRKQEETMNYYREHGVNPFASCLPLLLQLPVFISLFYLLRGGEFKQDIAGEASFLFIPDLAAATHGVVLVVLVVLYVATQLGATLVSAISAEKTQQRVMMALPFVFIPFIIQFQAGLIVYWITTNFWTFGQQLLVKKLMPMPAIAGSSSADGDDGAAGDSAHKGRSPRLGGAEVAPAAQMAGNGAGRPPPPSPRKKKKKRSGRRR